MDEKVVQGYAKMLYLTKTCLTTEEASKKAIKELCTPQEIAALGRLYDVEF